MMKRFQHYHCFSFVNQRRSCQWKLLSLLIFCFCYIDLSHCNKLWVSIVIFMISPYKISLPRVPCSPVSFIPHVCISSFPLSVYSESCLFLHVGSFSSFSLLA